MRLGILGAGAPGKAYATAAAAAGWKLALVADAIPERRAALAKPAGAAEEDDGLRAVIDPNLDAVCICLPTHLHAPVAIAALKAGKHVLIELPPAPNVKDAKAIAKAAKKSGKICLYGVVRRFGGPEQSARQAIEKGYTGSVYHARAAWLRTRGVPRGTGWYADPAASGGGALIDLGLPLCDLLLSLSNGARPQTVFATRHGNAAGLEVEEAGSLLLKLDSGATFEISVSWSLNQPPTQAGTTCRIACDQAAIDLYTPSGPVIYRQFDAVGNAKAVAMKQPQTVGHVAMLRHFKACITGKEQPAAGPADGVCLMQLAEAVYKSLSTGKSITLATAVEPDVIAANNNMNG
jgi:predicted dehydrogenase